jgi:hypothetical protein
LAVGGGAARWRPVLPETHARRGGGDQSRSRRLEKVAVVEAAHEVEERGGGLRRWGRMRMNEAGSHTQR